MGRHHRRSDRQHGADDDRRRRRVPSGVAPDRCGSGGSMMPIPHVIEDVWVYLSTTPLLWLTATLAAFLAGQWLFEQAGRRPLVNPVAIAVVLLIVLLKTTGTTYQTYFDGAQFVHFLLGPATVALAVPLHQNFGAVKRAALPILAALLVGSV